MEFWKRLEGKQYGMKNFFFSFFDTPNENLPSSFPSEILAIIFSALEKYNPEYTRLFVGEALQLRLAINDRNMTLPQIVAEAARR